MIATLMRAPTADVVISHGDDKVTFDFKYFEKRTGANFGTDDCEITVDPFYEINAYWKSLPQNQQADLFGYYQYIRTLFDTGAELETYQEQLTNIFAKILSFHPFDRMKEYVGLNVTINMPENITDKFDPNGDVIGTKELTYVRNDYRELIVMSIALRSVGIVMGEFINKVEKFVSNTWKELSAFYLLVNSWAFTSAPMERLELYIESNLKVKLAEDKVKMAPAIISGISTDEYPRWLMSLTLLRRVIFADITGTFKRPNVIESIYGFVQSKLNNNQSVFKTNVYNKQPEREMAGGEEQKLSHFEMYKSKTDIAIGESQIYVYYLSNIYQVAEHLQPGIDRALVEEFVHSCSQLNDIILNPIQLTMTRWMYSTAMPVKMLDRLDKPYVVIAIGIAAAVLWHRGFKAMACILASRFEFQETTVLYSSQVAIPKDITAQLNALYPYSQRQSAGKYSNPALKSMERVFEEVKSRDWISLLPLARLKEIGQKRLFEVPTNFNLELHNFVIDINERIKHELPTTVS